MTEQNVLSLSVGANGERWYHLDGRLSLEPAPYPVPSYDALGLAEFIYTAEAWHDLGRACAVGVASESSPDTFRQAYGANQNVWADVAQLWRSAGEAAELTAAALAEAAGLLSVTGMAGRTTPAVAGFIIEGATQYLIGVGHNLANIALRLCAENDAARRRLEGHKNPKKWIAEVRAGTNGRDAWLFHASARDLSTVLSSSRTAPARFTRTVARLEQGPAWQKMAATRHDYFHRWRYGYSAGDTDACDQARQFLSAALQAAAASARAAPSLYHAFLESNPKVRQGKLRGTPLQGPITVQLVSAGVTTEPKDLFDRVPFRG